jgi:hypothetical protein
MYAKLVVGGTDANLYQCIRDICRLLTSANPSTDDLSGSGFNKSSSVVLDATPAGWTYVGSTKATDQGAIGAGSADATFNSSVPQVWAVSAPMAGNSSRLKYACFTQTVTTTTTTYWSAGQLFGAQSVSPTGVVTGAGFYPSYTGGSTAINPNSNPICTAGSVLHLVATPRGIVLIREGSGMSAVLETTSTDAHEFYNAPAFVSLNNPSGLITNNANATGPQTTPGAFGATTFGVTDPNTGTYYAAYDATQNGVFNRQNLHQYGVAKAMSQDATGMSQYLIFPAYMHNHLIGYPVQYITGVFPLYWCRHAIGSTGDTVLVNGEEYKFFNCGSGTALYGVLMKTS